MGDAGLCRHCGGSGTRWTGAQLVWCRCSGRHGAAPDPVRIAGQTCISRADWPRVRERLARRRP